MGGCDESPAALAISANVARAAGFFLHELAEDAVEVSPMAAWKSICLCSIACCAGVLWEDGKPTETRPAGAFEDAAVELDGSVDLVPTVLLLLLRLAELMMRAPSSRSILE